MATTYGWKEVMFPWTVSIRCSGLNKTMCEHLGQGAEAWRNGDEEYAEAQYSMANHVLSEIKEHISFLQSSRSYIPKPLRDLPDQFQLPRRKSPKERAGEIGAYLRGQIFKSVIFGLALWYGIPLAWPYILKFGRWVCTFLGF